MDIENLKRTKSSLKSYLQENGYSQAYTKVLLHEIDRLISDSHFVEADSYESYYETHVVPIYKNSATLSSKRGMLGRIKSLDLYGVMPSKGHPSFLLNKGCSCQFSPEFNCFIDTCRTEWKGRSLAASTIDSRIGVLIKFFAYLTRAGIATFKNICEQDIRSYFFDGTSVIRGYDVVKIIRLSILDYLSVSHNTSCKFIFSFLPQIRKRHKIYPYLRDEEKQRIDSLLEAPGSFNLSKRDLAIFTLIYYTGIRRGDLVKLEVHDIDWDKDLILIKQGKTRKVNMLPLLPIVGNYILEYVEHERPDTESPYLFLSTNRIPNKLSGGTIYDIVEKVLSCAGVRVEGGRKGPHLLRHNLSMSLLRSGTSTPLISEILGHYSPNSVDAYLESDEKSLKKCALSVGDYPIGKEVFEVCRL